MVQLNPTRMDYQETFQQMIDEYKYVVPDVMDGWDQMPEYLQDQMQEVDLGELWQDGIILAR